MSVLLALFLASFGVYLAGACPTIYGGDSGELITTSVVLGIPHAPGYPLYILLGKVAENLIPWANQAYRINILSAVIMAATNCFAFSLFKKITSSKSAAFLGMLYLALSPVALNQARVAEVFGLNIFFIVLIFYVAFNFISAPGSQPLAPVVNLLAFLFGLGLGNHHTLILVIPALCIAVYKNCKPKILNFKFAILLFFFFLLGLSIYLYLPIRAAIHPDINFGDPHTWSRFVNVITRRVFGTLQLHPAALPMREFAITITQLKRFCVELYHQLGVSGILLGFVGVVYIARKRAGLALVVLFIISGPLFYVYANMSPWNALAGWRLERFLLSPLMGISACAAFGYSYLVAGRKLNTGRALFFTIMAIFIWDKSAVLAAKNLRYNFYFYEFGKNVLRELRPGANLLIDRVLFDEPASALSYLKLVEGQRPDVHVIYRPGTMFGLFYGEDYLELSPQTRSSRQLERETEFWSQSKGRPLYVMTFEKNNLPVSRTFKLSGLLYADRNNFTESMEQFIRREYLYHQKSNDYITRLILVHYPYHMAKAGLENGDIFAASLHFNSAVTLGADMEWLYSNIGALWSQYSDLNAAGQFYQKALSLDPYFPQTHFGLGYLAYVEGKFGEAVDAYRKATVYAPDFADAYYMWGVALHASGRTLEAKAPWEKYLSLEPNSPYAGDLSEILR